MDQVRSIPVFQVESRTLGQKAPGKTPASKYWKSSKLQMAQCEEETKSGLVIPGSYSSSVRVSSVSSSDTMSAGSHNGSVFATCRLALLRVGLAGNGAGSRHTRGIWLAQTSRLPPTPKRTQLLHKSQAMFNQTLVLHTKQLLPANLRQYASKPRKTM